MAMKQEGLKDGNGIEFLAQGGVNDREVDGQGMRAVLRAVSKNDFAKNHRHAQGLFGMVIGGRHVMDIKEGEQAVIVAFGIKESLSERFGLRVGNGLFADRLKFFAQPRDAGLGGAEGHLAGVAPLT